MTKSTGRYKTQPKSVLVIDPIAGRIDRHYHNGAVVIDIGSAHKNGYRVVYHGGRMHLNHRLIFSHFHGPIAPWMEIDHIHGTAAGDGVGNLRWTNRCGNMQNLRKATGQNRSSGLLGVTWCKRKERWKAQIDVSRKHINIGYFSTPEEAHAAYLAEKRKRHATCTI